MRVNRIVRPFVADFDNRSGRVERLRHVFSELYSILKENNIKIAVCSSSKNTKAILQQIELIDAFDAIVDGTDVSKSKPQPDIFLLACKRLDVVPKDCSVVQSSIAGIEAAKAVGMIAIAINDAKKSELADYKIDNLLDIKDIVLQEGEQE